MRAGVQELGHPAFVDRFLQRKIDAHKVLLERIPVIPDVQTAWLILSYCASAKANFDLRAISPFHSGEFARRHDEGIWKCFCQIWVFPLHFAQEFASLPLRTRSTLQLIGPVGPMLWR